MTDVGVAYHKEVGSAAEDSHHTGEHYNGAEVVDTWGIPWEAVARTLGAGSVGIRAVALVGIRQQDHEEASFPAHNRSPKAEGAARVAFRGAAAKQRPMQRAALRLGPEKGRDGWTFCPWGQRGHHPWYLLGAGVSAKVSPILRSLLALFPLVVVGLSCLRA